MSDSRIVFNETELLLLQLEMEGISTGVGYRFEIEGLDKANFISTGSGEIYSTLLVQKADEFGTVRKISFRVEYEGGRQVERENKLMLRIYRDGHITTTTEVEPDLLDNVIDNVVNIREYSGYIDSLNHMLDEYIHELYRRQTSRQKSRKITRIIESFDDVVDDYIEEGDTPGEPRIYQSLVANIGVRLCEGGVPPASDYFTDAPQLRDGLFTNAIKDFFTDYVRHTHDPTGPDVDHEELSRHLHHWLSQDWEAPLDMTESAVTTYDW